ncbi:hypothetical protein RJ55_07925 [Drechmeria coniospora]|nr:hypothetical protein RJ55_07925 [Drechmeria coniospora]
MFSTPSPTVYQSSSCFVTYGSMGHVDPTQPPSRNKPWTSLAAHEFIHEVDLIIPQDYYPVVANVVGLEQPSYTSISMSIGQLLEGEFFAQYLQKGGVSMLSDGRVSNDNTFTVHNGILTMYLDRQTFERVGLEGKPHGATGSHRDNPVWVVSYDFTCSSMVRGKRKFNKLLHACQNVLDEPLQWLFCHTHGPGPCPHPLDRFNPRKHSVALTVVQDVEVPHVKMSVSPVILSQGNRPAFEDTAMNLYEWLSLIRLQSPRITASDTIDPWKGFINARWLRRLVTDILTKCPQSEWFAVSATAFSNNFAGGSKDLTMLCPSEGATEYLMWEANSDD